MATVAGGNLVMFPNPLASESENLTREDSIVVSLFTNSLLVNRETAMLSRLGATMASVVGNF